MYQNSIFDNGSDKQSEQIELGLIGAMMDGWVEQFQFRGLLITNDRDFIVVRHPVTGLSLGGRTHIEGATVKQVHDWLEAKADIYPVEQ